MSGGIAYVLDENHDLYKRLNHELVKMYALDDATTTLHGEQDSTTSPDEVLLHQLIEQHLAETDSERAKQILSNWTYYRTCFKKIIPNDYLKIMCKIASKEKSGLAHDEAVLEAFKEATA